MLSVVHLITCFRMNERIGTSAEAWFLFDKENGMTGAGQLNTGGKSGKTAADNEYIGSSVRHDYDRFFHQTEAVIRSFFAVETLMRRAKTLYSAFSIS